jgi:HNH endonuclease
MTQRKLCSIPEGGKPAHARGYCPSHWSRWHRYGDPLRGGTNQGSAIGFAQEVATLTDTDECILWPYALHNTGYGILASGYRKYWEYAHRFICSVAHGPPPDDKHMAIHSCDTPQCVNPRHLRWGSSTDNAQDRELRGRSRWQRASRDR